jgi:putative PIN family toxin of toxin-antitoxin system
MIRVVLDTNIIVSAYLNEDGQPFRILKLALAGAIDLYASEPILEEYKELLQRKSYPMDSRRAALFHKKIRNASTVVKPAIKLSETTDPDDNIFLECAQAAKAEYLVTGNLRHFPTRWKYTRIVLPRQFIELWGEWHLQSKMPDRS